MSVLLKRNDTADVISFTCEYQDGSPADLTGSTVRFIMGKKNKVIAVGNASIINAVTGQVEYTLTDADTLVAGNFPAEFEVTFSNGKQKTFPTIGYLQVNIQPNLDLNRSPIVEDLIALRVTDIELFKAEVTANMAVANTFQAQIDNLQSQAGTDNTEIVGGRLSAKGVSHATLGIRLDTHEKDYTTNTGYGVTTGSANVYSVTLSPVPTGYVDGMTVRVRINIDSTAAATLNVNSLGAKALKVASGNDATNLKTNGIYTFVYNSSTGNFILQGEGVDVAPIITSVNSILGS